MPQFLQICHYENEKLQEEMEVIFPISRLVLHLRYLYLSCSYFLVCCIRLVLQSFLAARIKNPVSARSI